MCLEVSLDERSHTFHALPIHAKIAVAGSGGRAEMDRLRVIVEEKLDVVDKTEQEAGEFVVEVGLVFVDELRAGQRAENYF
jgi:hypothetical protein